MTGNEIMKEGTRYLAFTIMVGIAGGIPSPEDIDKHVRLGDIVVSEGVIQYDFIKETSEKIECRSSAAKPSAKLLEAIDGLKVKEYEDTYVWKSYIDTYAVKRFAKPDCEDILHDSMGREISHPEDSCSLVCRERVNRAIGTMALINRNNRGFSFDENSTIL